MATLNSAWGIDIGQCALKALKLREVSGQLQVEAFDIIEHPKILSQPDADQRQLIRNALEQFLARNNVAGTTVAIAVPGKASFTRFVKLPPVEPKRIPDIVRFEAEQQIPFPIAEVLWRWQMFKDEDSPDVEVGIFAMKRADVMNMLDHFTDVALGVDIVQMAPLALYNFMTFDAQVAPDGATLLADVGADKTDLVVSDGSRIWTRTIQIGGNNFTEALVRAFKLSFPKAEKLKRTAASSKYARQIFQAMRPVFADLVQEIQRSVGYYTSLHREARFKRLVGMGNGFRLPGLQKFLEQNLNMPVVRIDGFNRLSPSPAVNVPSFTENVLSFAVSYGLALQAMDQTAVSTNLLPSEIARKRLWERKRPWWVAAAAAVVLSVAGLTYGTYRDYNALSDDRDLVNARGIVSRIETQVQEYNKLKNQGKNELGAQAVWYMKLFGYRNFWPSLQAMLAECITDVSQKAGGDQQLIIEYAGMVGQDANTRKAQIAILDKLKATPRQKRRCLFMEGLDAVYLPDVSKLVGTGMSAAMEDQLKPLAGKNKKGFKLTFSGRTPLPQADVHGILNQLLGASKEMAKAQKQSEFSIVATDVGQYSRVGGAPGAAPAPAAPPSGGPAVAVPDPLFPDEDMVDDTRFELLWVVTIDNDGVKLPAELAEQIGR